MEQIDFAFTHAGIFHADDVFSAALLTYIFPNIKIFRGFEVDKNFNGLIFDIGYGEFDHHQTDKRVRENGVPFAAFGLLWEKFGKQIVGEEEAIRFDENFIQPLDLSDNTGEKNILSEIIASFNPTWDSDKTSDQAFEEAKLFALEILKRKFDYIFSKKRGENLLKDIISKCDNSDIIILPYFIPWKSIVCETNKKFVIYPSKRGGFNAQAVPVDKDSLILRCPFPENWRGKKADEIFKVSNLKGINFCHNSGFLISTDDEQTAISACEMAINKGGRIYE